MINRLRVGKMADVFVLLVLKIYQLTAYMIYTHHDLGMYLVYILAPIGHHRSVET